MSATTQIRTQCPACGARFRVPAGAAGHRARCSACHITFRVEELKRRRPPTDDDIIQWLCEDRDEGEAPIGPRILSGGRRLDPERPSDEEHKPAITAPASERHYPSPPPDGLKPPGDDTDTKRLFLRKTG